MRHQGRLMPIVAAAPDVTVRDGDNTVFVISPDGEPFGLLVDSIVDIIEHGLDVEIGGDAPGVIGVADIDGKAVELLDIAFFLEMARANQNDVWAGGGKRGQGAGKPGRRRLLLIDDAAFFRDMLAATLQAQGFDVVKAGSGADALACVLREPGFDVLLVDVELPDASGFELAERLREAGARAPMVAIAPYATREITRSALAAGMVGAVGKFQRAQMMDLLRSCIEDEEEQGQDQTFARGVAA
jgi:two-component system chemotaxis sensor kinase CheA